MAIDFRLPDLGENIESGDIVNVLVNEGDQIAAEQGVLEVETGKAVIELPCPHAGRVTKIHVKKGSKVKPGDALLTLEGSNGAAAPTAAQKSAPPQSTAAASAKQAPASPPVASPAPTNAAPAAAVRPAASPPAAKPTLAAKEADKPTRTPPAGPATRRLARELGVDLAAVEGSGAGGRITEDDIKAAVRKGTAAAQSASPSGPAVRTAALPEGSDERDAWGVIRRQAMPKIRKTIAMHMHHSASTIPHVTNFDDADITELEHIRKGGLVDYIDPNIKLTMMPFVIKAIAQSLKLHPIINTSIDMENETITYKQYVNIGVAVDTERGLIVPVIRNVDRMSIPAIAQALGVVAEKARKSQFTVDDLKGATFTISNLGAVGGTYSTPIINHPDVAILLTGRSRKLPVVIDDKIEIRLMMPLSLSYDHRIVDGATAARFLNEVIGYLKNPGRLLLAP
jgi:pyruvate/2-oxoglutarate dehydrogenase complex dihydrolipoamide acyltransferase (E2) component